MDVIARIHTEFPSKFGIPRQSGLTDALRGEIAFEPAFRNPDALRGIEGFSHLWLIWGFSEAKREGFRATVRPPRLGGNQRMGVFATRSPFRPNGLGLSCVRRIGLRSDAALGTVLIVGGADLMDGTPIYDIKPYLPFTDCRSDATGGFAEAELGRSLRVDCPAELLSRIPEAERDALLSVLSQDPRPAYQDDPERVYGFPFAGWDVRFCVTGTLLRVTDIVPLSL